jgi:hypothetical protein
MRRRQVDSSTEGLCRREGRGGARRAASRREAMLCERVGLITLGTWLVHSIYYGRYMRIR